MKKRLNIVLVTCLSILLFNACKNESASICSGFEGETTIKNDCFDNDEVNEIFTVVENMPVFGTNGEVMSVKEYFSSRLEENQLCGIEEVSLGRIILRMVIGKTGKACLSHVILKNTYNDNALQLKSIVDEMPNWTPGTQRDEAVHVYINVGINIVDGVIDSISGS